MTTRPIQHFERKERGTRRERLFATDLCTIANFTVPFRRDVTTKSREQPGKGGREGSAFVNRARRRARGDTAGREITWHEEFEEEIVRDGTVGEEERAGRNLFARFTTRHHCGL